MTLSEYIEQLKPEGIEIEDRRSLGMKISVQRQPFKRAHIANDDEGFCLNLSGSWLHVASARQYAIEILQVAEICETLNRLIAAETQQITSK